MKKRKKKRNQRRGRRREEERRRIRGMKKRRSLRRVKWSAIISLVFSVRSECRNSLHHFESNISTLYNKPETNKMSRTRNNDYFELKNSIISGHKTIEEGKMLRRIVRLRDDFHCWYVKKNSLNFPQILSRSSDDRVLCRMKIYRNLTKISI